MPQPSLLQFLRFNNVFPVLLPRNPSFPGRISNHGLIQCAALIVRHGKITRDIPLAKNIFEEFTVRFVWGFDHCVITNVILNPWPGPL